MAANFRAWQEAEEAEHRRLADLAAKNERAIAKKEAADQRRFEKMKDRADWEARRRERHKYLYCHHDGVNAQDPTGNAEFSLSGMAAVTNFAANMGLRILINELIFLLSKLSRAARYM